MITIEKGIAIPTYGHKYPFDEMQVGDSFALPIEERIKVASAALQYKKRKDRGFRYSVRKHNGQIRIWRTA